MTITCFITAAAMALLAACGLEPEGQNDTTSPKERADISLTKVQQQISCSANTFTFDFLKAACAAEPDGKNIFVSPFSIQMALAMTAAGAAGDTQQEMYSALGFDGFSGEDVGEFYQSLIPALQEVDNTTVFEIANSFWSRKDIVIKKNYTADIMANFFAEVLDLAGDPAKAAGEINAWCSDKTHGMINKIVDAVPASTKACLLNAIYFKGIWADKFDAGSNTDAPFQNWDGTTTKAAFMNQTFDQARVYSDDYAQAISLPYGNRAWSMTIVMPREGTSLEKLLAGLDDGRWQLYNTGGRSYQTIFSMPRFEEEYAAEKLCIKILQDMGMQKAFTGAADFSAMSTSSMCIDDVRHKAKIKVDEEGTEAAVVSSAGMMKDAAVGPGDHVVFHADHPFLYLITESSTGAILFAGRYSGK